MFDLRIIILGCLALVRFFFLDRIYLVFAIPIILYFLGDLVLKSVLFLDLFHLVDQIRRQIHKLLVEPFLDFDLSLGGVCHLQVVPGLELAELFFSFFIEVVVNRYSPHLPTFTSEEIVNFVGVERVYSVFIDVDSGRQLGAGQTL